MCKDGACIAKEGYCDTDGDCSNGQVCKNNKCTACGGDAECGADKRCSNGACLARGACNVDEDCADDEDCINGICQRPGREKPPELSCQLETVYFGFDSFSVEGEAGTVLEKNVECIKQAPQDRGLILYGHTDPRGTEEYNIALSEKRANAVADFIARLGIDPVRLNVVPKGEGEASGTDESGWGKDRRVELQWK
jgi:peptidoglycan-associated lipoprotein